MNFSIGIITDGTGDDRILKIVQSIENLNMPNYEIIVVGNSKVSKNNVKIIEFDENIKKAWITKKKNLITENATYENIVYSHDYIEFEPNWYKGFLSFGGDFDVCMNKIITPSGARYRDWTLDAMASILHITGNDRRYERLLPYDEFDLNDIMYISGAYWVAKKSFMERFPLDESLCWGESEDIEWSYRVRKNTKFSMNTNSTVKLLKTKDPSFKEMGGDLLNVFKSLSEKDLNKIKESSKTYYEKTFGRGL